MASVEVDSLLRAAHAPAPANTLDGLSARARRLAAEHPVWPAWLALGIVERRRGSLASARDALSSALDVGGGSAEVHRELARVLVGLSDAPAALLHAERAVALGGESPRNLATIAEALLALGRRAEGEAMKARALALAPDDAEVAAITAPRPAPADELPRTPLHRLKELLRRRGR
jgi:tetratricopeptide (TPR) repeat protein